MTNKQFRAVILKSESKYQLDQTLADGFQTLDVTVGPKTDYEGSEVVGTVDDCWYNGDIICDVSIYNEDISELLEEGEAAVCPTLARQLGDTKQIDAMDIFVSSFPGEEVGSVEEIDG